MKKLLIAGPAGLLAAAVIGAVAVSAASPSPSPGNPSSIFVSKLAGILHLSTAQTAGDLKQAQLQTVDQMVKDGTITKAQGDAMKQRIQAGKGVGPFFGPGRRGFGPRDAQLMRDLRTAELNAAASSLGMQPADLEAQLRSGKTIADLEAAKNVPDSTVRSAVTAAAKKVLDAAVKAGKVTQAQENDMLARIQSGREPLGGPGPHPGGPGFAGSRTA